MVIRRPVANYFEIAGEHVITCTNLRALLFCAILQDKKKRYIIIITLNKWGINISIYGANILD